MTKNNLSPRAMLLQALEMADPLWPDPHKMRVVPALRPGLLPPTPPEPLPLSEPIPMLHETHCIVWLRGMSLVRENLPHILRPGAYYSEDANSDFQFVKRSVERGESAYNTRVTWHTDTHSDATPKPTFPIAQNAKLMEFVEVMEKRRDMTRAMIDTSILIYQEKIDGSEDDREQQDNFAVICFLQDLRNHPDLLRLEIDLMPTP